MTNAGPFDSGPLCVNTGTKLQAILCILSICAGCRFVLRRNGCAVA